MKCMAYEVSVWVSTDFVLAQIYDEDHLALPWQWPACQMSCECFWRQNLPGVDLDLRAFDDKKPNLLRLNPGLHKANNDERGSESITGLVTLTAVFWSFDNHESLMMTRWDHCQAEQNPDFQMCHCNEQPSTHATNVRLELEGRDCQGDKWDCDAGTSAAAILIDWVSNWSATTRQREKKGSLCTDYPLIHDCFGFFVSHLIHDPCFCCLSLDGWCAVDNWVWLRAKPLNPCLSSAQCAVSSGLLHFKQCTNTKFTKIHK